MTYRYRTVKVNGKTKLLHRHIMEQWLDRALDADEHVHHRNGERHDNRIENLELVTHAEHMKHHKQKYPLTKPCEVCGVVFTPKPTKRKRQKTCSRECRDILISRTERETKARLRAERRAP